MIIVVTYPHAIPGEEEICNQLFGYGLHTLHLRKPDYSHSEYESFIQKIDPYYRDKIVIHDHFDLVNKYGLKGIHLNRKKLTEFCAFDDYNHISVSCHSLKEIEQLDFTASYIFLSPIFDSISKAGYSSNFTLKELEQITISDQKIIALGGVTAENISICRKVGFFGSALLGYIWENPQKAVEQFKRIPPAAVLSIAGFDPSSGAGVTADIKTFEQCGAYGLGVCTAITFQNQHTYNATRWLSVEEIIDQCRILISPYRGGSNREKEFRPIYIKIGLIESLEVLDIVTDFLHSEIPNVKIIWDPINRASAGHIFHKEMDKEVLSRILNRIYLITPNMDEIALIITDSYNYRDNTSKNITERVRKLSKKHNLNILCKGGHASDYRVIDHLFTPLSESIFTVPRESYDKHGTGCVLSSAITALLSRGYSLEESCRAGQRYIADFIRSTPTLLGVHRFISPLSKREPDIRKQPLIYITDHKDGITIPEQVEAVCRGGCQWVQLRMKNSDDKEIIKTGKLVKAICLQYGAIFTINDRPDIALQLQADGVHLGKNDMNPLEARKMLGEGKIIGATCNTIEDIYERVKQQVDYIGLGPFAYTTTKKRLSPILGLSGYQHIFKEMKRENIDIPIYAIGGIKENDIPDLMKSEIAGVALSSLLKESDDITEQTKDILKIISIPKR